MNTAYPKALTVQDFKLGQKVILFMTHNGTERAKHGLEFDKWCVPACVESIGNNILSVKIDEFYKKLYGFINDTISFYINNRFHEVGKTKADFRLFLNKGDAYRYEHFRVLNQEYHKKNKKKRNQAAREYQAENADSIRERKKKYRHDNPDLTTILQQRYYNNNKDKILAYHKKRRSDNREEINRKQRETRHRLKEICGKREG